MTSVKELIEELKQEAGEAENEAELCIRMIELAEIERKKYRLCQTQILMYALEQGYPLRCGMTTTQFLTKAGVNGGSLWELKALGEWVFPYAERRNVELPNYLEHGMSTKLQEANVALKTAAQNDDRDEFMRILQIVRKAKNSQYVRNILRKRRAPIVSGAMIPVGDGRFAMVLSGKTKEGRHHHRVEQRLGAIVAWDMEPTEMIAILGRALVSITTGD